MTDDSTDKTEIIPEAAETASVATEDAQRIVPSHASSIPEEEAARITKDLIAALKTVYDPEIPVDIYELGLIYGIDIAEDNAVRIRMTLTAPGCPVAGSLVAEVERKIESLDEVKSCNVDLVWDPPWTKERMSEAALLELGLL